MDLRLSALCEKAFYVQCLVNFRKEECGMNNLWLKKTRRGSLLDKSSIVILANYFENCEPINIILLNCNINCLIL